MDKYLSIINDINKLSYTMQNKGDNQLKEVSNQLKQRACQNENLDILLVEAFALVKETAQRVLKITPFDVQLIGAIVLHQGKIAEMQTGEGKTLAAVFSGISQCAFGQGSSCSYF